MQHTDAHSSHVDSVHNWELPVTKQGGEVSNIIISVHDLGDTETDKLSVFKSFLKTDTELLLAMFLRPEFQLYRLQPAECQRSPCPIY
jgi:hypothetical protein